MIRLPIDEFKEEIISAVDENQVVVISAETGAGKSTRVPEFLAKAGYSVVVTEPRRVAAVTLAERVSEELKTALGDVVGFATGFEKNFSKETEILFATDGLQLVKELNNRSKVGKRVLILDEIHEMNLNMETLVSWCKKQIDEKSWDTKVIIMSATLDADEMVNYFGKEITKVIPVPGSLFDVSFEQKKDYELEDEIKKAISLGENTLVFLPGKREIEQLAEELEDQSAIVLPLHGELSYQEQKKCFQKYNLPKVVLATNVAQTSITLSDIDCVIDTGLERRIETEDGIEGLFLRDISQKDVLQRKGRAGRTHEGRYVLCSNKEFRFRDEFAIPEIYRLSLEQVVLKLASVSIDATKISFLHQPGESKIEEAKKLLINLGALTQEGELTEIGREMSKMPVSARIARMLIEARKYGYMKPAIIIAAILENGSLKVRGSSYKHTNGAKFSSDLMYELNEYYFVRDNAPIDFKEEGINAKTYFRVLEYVKKLNSLYESELEDVEVKEDIMIKIIFSGMRDLLFFSGYSDRYQDIENKVEGAIDKNSSCYFSFMPVVVGFPHKIEFNSRWGAKETLLIISLCTQISPNLLVELDPENSSKEEENIKVTYFDWTREYLVRRRVSYYYKGYNFYTSEEDIEDEDVRQMAIEKYQEKRKRELEEEQRRLEKEREEYAKSLEEIRAREHAESYVMFGDKEYYVNDRYSLSPTILLYREDLEKDLPDEAKYKGIKICFQCDGRTSTSIETLRAQVGLKLLTDKLNREIGRKEKIDSYEQLLEVLKSSCEQKVSVVFASRTYEETIYKYVEIEGKNYYFITTAKKVDVSEKVKEVLQAIFKKEAEKKYSENAFFFVIKGERTLTNKGSKAYSKYRDEKIMVLEGLTVDNFEDSMEYLGLVYEEAISMLG